MKFFEMKWDEGEKDEKGSENRILTIQEEDKFLGKNKKITTHQNHHQQHWCQMLSSHSPQHLATGHIFEGLSVRKIKENVLNQKMK